MEQGKTGDSAEKSLSGSERLEERPKANRGSAFREAVYSLCDEEFAEASVRLERLGCPDSRAGTVMLGPVGIASA